MMRTVLFALLLVAVGLGLAGCKEKKTKAQLYAEREQQILKKMELLLTRQGQIANKLVELEGRLAIVRQRRAEIENRWAEPTPTLRPTRPPDPS
jgi:hypothetical protein